MKWNWKPWLVALASSPLSEKQKLLGQSFYKAMRSQKKAIAPWQLDGAPSYGDLSPLVIYGLVYLLPGVGHFIPDLDLLPGRGTIEVDAPMRRLLRQILNGKELYRINEPGYITQRDDPRRWVLRKGLQSIEVPLSDSAAEGLGRLRLIEPDGCGHGWPFQYTSRFRVNQRRLAGVAGFRETGLRWIRERMKQSTPTPAVARQEGTT